MAECGFALWLQYTDKDTWPFQQLAVRMKLVLHYSPTYTTASSQPINCDSCWGFLSPAVYGLCASMATTATRPTHSKLCCSNSSLGSFTTVVKGGVRCWSWRRCP